jgi:hypothetical protein
MCNATSEACEQRYCQVIYPIGHDVVCPADEECVRYISSCVRV